METTPLPVSLGSGLLLLPPWLAIPVLVQRSRVIGRGTAAVTASEGGEETLIPGNKDTSVLIFRLSVRKILA